MPGTFDIRDVASTAKAVVASIGRHPDRDSMYFFKSFPRESCTGASFVIGQILLERDLGDWALTVHRDADGNLHGWLELGSRDGRVLVLDATVHQFQDLSERGYLGLAPTPALARFSNGEEYRYMMSEPDSHAAGRVPQFRQMLEWVRGDVAPLEPRTD